ncbi:MAG: hypothetical protein RL468_2167 [Pseudomonadota bacterium]|jgi:two-component system sensor histidine kinase TctE
MSTDRKAAVLAKKPLLRVLLVQHVLWPLALTWLLGTAGTVAVAYYFAQKAFDRALLDDAFALASRVRLEPQGLTLELSTREMGAVLFDQSENIYFVVRRQDGTVMAGHPDLQAPAPGALDAVRFSDTVYQGRRMRAVSLVQEEPRDFLVVVAQTTGSRDALLKSVLQYSVVPQLLLLLALAFWLRRVIEKELQPLNELEQSVQRRDALDLTPVNVSAGSRDIEHLSAAINALLARLDRSMSAQRDFSGNVAHELRTPLAGIRALAEYGLNHVEPEVWRDQLRRIADSEARASRLVEQLLALALAEEEDKVVSNAAVDLEEVAREVVLRYLPRADAAGVDLGLQGLEPAVQVSANAALVEGILGNLIDNALRYGQPPAGKPGRVTVALERLDAGRVRLSVIDNGPGLSPAECQQLLQRGVRGANAPVRLGQGAGLGLAIVAKFARVMHADLALGPAPQGPGLCASLVFEAPSGSESALPAQ